MTVTENCLLHTRRKCKYQWFFIPKCRKKVIFINLKNVLGECFLEFAARKDSRILEGHIMPDHAHILLSIPPKYSVSQVVGYMKGKCAIWIVQNFYGRQQNCTGRLFWARGNYCTVGCDEKVIMEYIRNQENVDILEDCQLGLVKKKFGGAPTGAPNNKVTTNIRFERAIKPPHLFGGIWLFFFAPIHKISLSPK